MQYEIEVGGRLRKVTVVRAGDRLAVSVDDRSYLVDAARIDAQTLSLVVDGGEASAPRTYDTTIAADAAGHLIGQVGAIPVAVSLKGRRGNRSGPDGAGASGGPETIRAPMPGKVVRVLVQAGDLVRARQPVVVVEAMKMENELRAGRDGTVAEICVGEGLSVEAGSRLLVIE